MELLVCGSGLVKNHCMSPPNHMFILCLYIHVHVHVHVPTGHVVLVQGRATGT